MSELVPYDTGPVEVQLRLDIIHMHEQVLGQARSTLERALECGRLIYDLALQLDVPLTTWWLANDMPFSENMARRYRRLWHYHTQLQLADVKNITGAERLLRNLPQTGTFDRYGCPTLAPEVREEIQALAKVGTNGHQIAKKLGVTHRTVYATLKPVQYRESQRKYQRERSRRQRQAMAEKRQIEREGKRALAARALKNDPDLSKAYGYLRQAMAIVDAMRVKAEGDRRIYFTNAYGNLTTAEAELLRVMRAP